MRGFTLQQLVIQIRRVKRHAATSKPVRRLRSIIGRLDAFIFRIPRRYLIAHRHTRYTRFINKLYAFRGAAMVAALVLVFHILSPAFTPQLAFALNGNANLNGFIWENDDDTSPDGNTQLAAGNAAVTVPANTRLNLRAQIKNTGTAMDLSKLGLFYDRNDGLWSRVRNQTVNKPDGESLANPSHMVDRSSAGASSYSSSAIDSSGTVWISYGDATSLALRVAKYVGSGGTGCSSSAWTCTNVDNSGNNNAAYNSIAIDPSGNPWISYYDNSLSALRVATYVGTGGNCTSTAWNCVTVDNTGTQTGQFNAIAFDSTGTAWVSFYDTTNTALRVAKYVGTGGNCTSTAWNCSAVDNTGTATGQYTSIAVDASGNPWVSFHDTTNTSLRVATYVGTGGNCTDTAWNCSAVDNTGTSTGTFTSIAINPRTNRPWVSYLNVTGTSLKVAEYVVSSGNCTDTAWNCTVVDNSGTATGESTAIAFDATGAAWVSYRDTFTSSVKLARYTIPDHNSLCSDGNWTCARIEGGNTGLTTTDVVIDSAGDAWVSFFGDNFDGIFVRKVNARSLATHTNQGSCWQLSGFVCGVLDNTASVGQYTATAIAPNGTPWITYYDTTNTRLMFANKTANYSDGVTCSDDATWECGVIDNTGTNTGQFTSIAFDSAGIPWVSYYDVTNTSLRVAKYVGSGGNCTSAAWNCSAVDNTNAVGQYSSIAIDASGNPWVSYTDTTNTSLRVAKYVGSGGNCTDAAWNCSAVDNTSTNTGLYASIAIDASGNPWVSYYDSGTNTSLRVAKYVGSGGNCTDAAWNCSTVDNTGTNTGQYTSITIDPSGNPWVAYQDATNLALKAAKYVGSGGNCTDTAWNCSTVESDRLSLAVGTNGIALAIDPAGNPAIAFRDATSSSVNLAKYVGSGGNCTDTAWNCFTLDDESTNKGTYVSLAFDQNGKMWMAYENSTNTSLEYMYSNRYGDIIMSSSQRATGALSESHVDMTTTSDTTNRDDADCVGGGTWNNGVMVFGDMGAIGTLPDGTGTAQCTEIVFTIDLTQAITGATYRFMIASFDNVSSGRNMWRGPVTIAGGATPTLTISSTSGITTYAAKDATIRLPNCTDTDWGCADVVTTDSVGAFGSPNTLTLDRQGNPWMAYYNDTSDDLVVAEYVGTGGSGCATSAWNCTTVDSTNDVGKYASLVFDQTGSPWISYYDTTNGNLRVANYVASGGSGCATATWNCTAVDTTNDVGQYGAIAVDLLGRPMISYYDATGGNLRVAQYLSGSTLGTGCAVNTWTCTAVDTTNDVGQYTSIDFDDSGIPWISYYDVTNGDLRVVRYYSQGSGTCAALDWYCTTVESTNDVGKYSSIVADGKVAVAYYESPSGSCDNSPTTECSLHFAREDFGSGCADVSWGCAIVDNPTGTGDLGKYPSLTIGYIEDAISYYDAANGDVRVARLDANLPGNASSGCTTTELDWTCSTVDSTNDVGAYSSIITDDNGTRAVAYFDTTSGNLRFAKEHRYDSYITTFQGAFEGYSGGRSKTNAIMGRHVLSPGRSASAAEGSCSGVNSDYLGKCGIYQNNGDYDTIDAQINESPTLVAAFFTLVTQSELPTIRWIGKTSLAPNTAGTTGDIVLQIYNVTNNTWDTLATDSSSSNCSSDNCTLTAIPPSGISDYLQTRILNGVNAFAAREMLLRVYQEASSSSSITFKTDQFSIFTTAQKMGTGSLFQDGVERPLNQR